MQTDDILFESALIRMNQMIFDKIIQKNVAVNDFELAKI